MELIMIRNKKQETRVVDKRLLILILFFALFSIILFGRLVYIQMIQHDNFAELSRKNILKENYLIPKRGEIVDRKDRVIADNRPMYYAVVVPEEIEGFKKNKQESAEAFVNRVSEFISLEDKQKNKLVTEILRTPMFKEVVVKTDLDEKELSEATSNIKYLKGLNISSAFVRQYPYKDMFLSVLGYVGKATQKDFDNYDGTLTNLDYIGKTGLEYVYQKQIHGIHGQEIIAINAGGRIINREVKYAPVQGQKLITTLDLDLQQIASDMLKGEKGAVVAMDPNNGNILAFVSTPSYDANQFIKGITTKEYNEFFKVDSPLFNRVLMGQYPPASTFKPFVGMAALEGEYISPNEQVFCGPYYSLPGSRRKFLDWKRQGHGNLDMIQAIAVSADVYFYKLGTAMGIDYLHDVVKHFGFGDKTGIVLQGEKPGLLPSTAWKKQAKKEQWWKGESVIAAIGQGYTVATPLQMAVATSMLVNGGTKYKPRLTNLEDVQILDKVNFKKENVNIIKSGMREVVHGKRGTARGAIAGKNKIDFEMGGKTGTAQVYSTHGVKDAKAMAEKPKHLKDHALFIGFAPFEHPEIVVAVIVENGEHGSTTSTPIAVAMMRKYLEKEKPVEVVPATPATTTVTPVIPKPTTPAAAPRSAAINNNANNVAYDDLADVRKHL
jgi:penicillin-binding protein 2